MNEDRTAMTQEEPEVPNDNKRTYTVIIEEHIAQEFTVRAYDVEDALDISIEKYHQGEFVVEPSTPTCQLMMAREEDTGIDTEWEEF